MARRPIAIGDNFEQGTVFIYGEPVDNAKLFEQRFQSVFDELFNLARQPSSNAINRLADLMNRTYKQKEQLIKNLRARTEADINRMAMYGLSKGKQAELEGQLINSIAEALNQLEKERTFNEIRLGQLSSLYDLQDYAQKLGQYGVLADLLKITPVNEEALRQQALASGQLASLMTSSAPAYQPSSTSILFPLLGAGLGYFLGGGLGGASLGFGLGGLLGSLF